MLPRSPSFGHSTTKRLCLNGLSAATLLLIGGSPAAFGLVNFAQGELDVSATVAGTYDSRVRGAVSAEDDYFFSLSPSLIYQREVGRIKLDSRLGVSVIRYMDLTSQDAENLSGMLMLSVPEASGTRLKLSSTISYDERQRLDLYEAIRISEETFDIRGNFDLVTGPRTAVGGSAGFATTKTDVLNDQEIFRGRAFFSYSDFLGGANLSTEYTYTTTDSTASDTGEQTLSETAQALSLILRRPIIGRLIGSGSIGYRMYDRSSDVEAAWGRNPGDGMIFSASIQGPFLPPSLFPKLESSASLSYSNSETPGINDDGQRHLTGSLTIAWQARERTKLRVGVHRSQSLSLTDFSVVDTTVDVGITQTIGERVDFAASAGYTDLAYENSSRSEDVTFANASLRYTFVAPWSAALTYRWESRDASDDSPTASAARSFDRSLVSASFTVRY